MGLHTHVPLHAQTWPLPPALCGTVSALSHPHSYTHIPEQVGACRPVLNKTEVKFSVYLRGKPCTRHSSGQLPRLGEASSFSSDGSFPGPACVAWWGREKRSDIGLGP